MTAPGVVRKRLIELINAVESTTNNALVIALILSKTEPNIFLGKDAAEWRGVITFTVRDSKRDIVNCKYWGSKEKVEEYQRRLQIGDIIEIVCPRVCLRTPGVDRFQPLSTLPYTLVLNEGQSFLNKYSDQSFIGNDKELYDLLRKSHKPLCSALTLADVRASSAATITANTNDQRSDTKTQAQFVDLLVAVVVLRSAKELRSSHTGQLLHCLEVIVCDRSLSDGMVLTIWNSNWIQRAQNYWQPRRTVLHMIDVRVSYSDFYKSAALSLTGRTLLYENPCGSETQQLLEYVATLPPGKDFDILAQSGCCLENLPSPDSILTQMTVKQLYARTEGNLKESSDSEEFTAVLYVMVTKFDIDGQSLITSRKCKSCQRFMMANQICCTSEQCQLTFSLNYSGKQFKDFFNINLHLSDHTATLVETRFQGSIAERILGVGVEDYLGWSDEQKEQLKWRHLMQHHVVKVLVKKVNAVRRNLVVIVVDMKPVQLEELAQKMMVF